MKDYWHVSYSTPIAFGYVTRLYKPILECDAQWDTEKFTKEM